MKRRLFACLLLSAALLLALPLTARGEAKLDYVNDYANILSADMRSTLNARAAELSQQYGFPIYIVVVQNMDDYVNGGIERFAEEVFRAYELGVGDSGDGVLLAMSMAGRDYDVYAHGDFGNYAFTDYGKKQLADTFLDNFRANDWAGGFADYISECDYMLTRAENGDPIDVSGYSSRQSSSFGSRLGRSIAPGVIVGIIIAFIYGGSLKRKMKSAKIAREAAAYIVERGIRMQDRQDVFTHTTVTRQRIERDSGSRSGGTSVNSSGHSHSSGKF